MRKPHVGLVGYYGHGNYGDELFKDALSSCVPDVTFEVLDVVRLSTDSQYFRYFQDTVDVVLLGGGDLIIPYAWAEWYFSDILLTKPLFIFGVGVPTWGGVDPSVVDRLRAFVQHPSIRFIGVRDIESRHWMEQHLAPRVPVQDFPDMVCALSFPTIAKPSGPPILTLITRHQRPGEIQWGNLVALCERATGYGYRIRNLVLGFGAIAEDDMKTIEAEAPRGIWELVQHGDNKSLTIAIAESTMVASMKFHGCVVAAMLGIPAIGLSTTDKFRNFYKSIERPDLIAHHTHANLADRLPTVITPISKTTIALLRSGAEKGLRSLQDHIQKILH